MTERPMLYAGELVCEILSGRKTQTRRICRAEWMRCLDPTDPDDHAEMVGSCPHGKPGDRIWVRESWASLRQYDGMPPSAMPTDAPVFYRATGDDGDHTIGKWRPSLHMPRWASRITLELTSVRLERLWELTEPDARAEGVGSVDAFVRLWDEINGARGFRWKDNPWVWALGFRVESVKR